MKKYLVWMLLPVVFALTLASCEKDDNDVPDNLDVQDFVWKGLNLYYLWQADVPDLADSRFSSQNDLNAFLYGYPDPADLFEHLLNRPTDRFSVIFSDYTKLEGILAGTTKNNGADINLYYKDASETDVIAVVNYILPNSDASGKDIRRGDIIYAIDGQTLNVSNYSALLNADSYTADLADYNGGNFEPNGRSVLLTKTVLSENPVYISSVINQGSHRIGYLMYNGFYPDYEPQLNAAFGSLASQNITDFVLDLRYNGGGSIATAGRLASMITGQFAGQLFAKEQWNAKIEDYDSTRGGLDEENYCPTAIGTGAGINSINMSKMYVITSKGTASASELVINGLTPYIDVVKVGDTTVGKNVGSITMYDSPTFTKKDISTKHHYAMQPLVLKIANRDGFSDYTSGLVPNIELKETLANRGVLGDPTEPLLAAVISQITMGGRHVPVNPSKDFRKVQRTDTEALLRNEMYVEKLPPGFVK